MSIKSAVIFLAIYSTLVCNAEAETNTKDDVIQDLWNKYKAALGLSSRDSADTEAENRAQKTAWGSDPDQNKYLSKRAGDPMLPDGLPGTKFIGPGKPPAKAIEKRNGQEECGDDEWFVFVDERSACVQPQWESAYDPTFCTRMRNKWVYCGCDDVTNIPGMKDGIDTCIDKAQVEKDGRCSIRPCKAPYTCVESQPGSRYDCVHGEITIPTWYGDEEY